MDQESIVYGCIRDSATGDDDSRHQRMAHNHRIIDGLPDADGWPFLSRDMFGVTGMSESEGTYQTQVIHFGASYRAIEYEWQDWLAKFESVLREMHWISAKVHLETELSGHHTFMWETHGSAHQPGESLSVRCEWEREGAFFISPTK